MEKIKCIVVDDEPLAIDILRGYIDRIPQLEMVGSCKDAMEAFQQINTEKIDLIFLDINLPGLNGIDFIRSLAANPAVIITTAYREYAIESYEIDVVDYLMKPIAFGRFFAAVGKFLKTKNINPTPETRAPSVRSSIYVYSEKKNIKVYLEEILFIESIKDYVRIHTDSQRIVSKDTLSKYSKMLPDNFLRIHRSYVVNLDKITAYTAHDVEIGTKEIPIGTSYKKEVSEILSRST